MASFRAVSREGHAAMSLRGDQPDRWILIQKNTFTNWVNEQLRGSGIEHTEFVEELGTDFENGVKLCRLVEALQGKKIRVIKRPLNHHQMLENHTQALTAIANDNVRLVNIGKSGAGWGGGVQMLENHTQTRQYRLVRCQCSGNNVKKKHYKNLQGVCRRGGGISIWALTHPCFGLLKKHIAPWAWRIIWIDSLTREASWLDKKQIMFCRRIPVGILLNVRLNPSPCIVCRIWIDCTPPHHLT